MQITVEIPEKIQPYLLKNIEIFKVEIMSAMQEITDINSVLIRKELFGEIPKSIEIISAAPWNAAKKNLVKTEVRRVIIKHTPEHLKFYIKKS